MKRGALASAGSVKGSVPPGLDGNLDVKSDAQPGPRQAAQGLHWLAGCGVRSTFDIESHAISIWMIPSCESLNRKGTVWPREMII